MNRNREILIIVLCSILIIFLVQILVRGTSRGMGLPMIFNASIGNSNWTEENEYSASLDNVKHIKLDTSVDNIIIEEANEKNIKIIEKSNYKLEDDEKLKINKKDSTLEIIRDDKKSLIGKNNINRKLQIYLPKDYNNSITLENSVGDIVIYKDLKLDELNISQNVGDLKLESNIECNKFSFKNKVGDIDIENINGKGDIDAKVGNIECYLDDIIGDVSIEAKTGDIDLEISKDASFKLDSKYNVGDMDTNISLDNYRASEKSLSGSYGKDVKHTVNLKTNVGDVSINVK